MGSATPTHSRPSTRARRGRVRVARPPPGWVSADAVDHWIPPGTCPSAAAPATGLVIPWTLETEAACRATGLPESASPQDPRKPKNPLLRRQYETTVPTVADRVVQAVLKLVLEPIFEVDF